MLIGLGSGKASGERWGSCLQLGLVLPCEGESHAGLGLKLSSAIVIFRHMTQFPDLQGENNSSIISLDGSEEGVGYFDVPGAVGGR